MIRDRIVVGLLDVKLSERLQLNSNLTLESAVTQARQSEEVHKQQTVVQNKLKTHQTTMLTQMLLMLCVPRASYQVKGAGMDTWEL